MSDDALLAAIGRSSWERNGVPESKRAADRARAAEIVEEVLREALFPGGVRTSVLGPGWANDVDAHVRDWPPAEPLLELGWLPLDGLLARLGIRERGRWAVVEAGEVVGSVDLHSSPPPGPVEAVLGRCSRRGAVRLREVLELRALRRAGHALPGRHRVLAVAADVEAGLGGDVLSPWRTGRRRPCPAPVARRGRVSAGLRRRLRRRRVVVAVCGTDAFPRSAIAGSLVAKLEAAGVPSGIASAPPQAPLTPLADARSGPGGTGGPSLFLIGRHAASVRRRIRRIRGVAVLERHGIPPLALRDSSEESLPPLQRAFSGRVLPRGTQVWVLVQSADETTGHDDAGRSRHSVFPATPGQEQKQGRGSGPLPGVEAIPALPRRHRASLRPGTEVFTLDAGRAPAESSRIILERLVRSFPPTRP